MRPCMDRVVKLSRSGVEALMNPLNELFAGVFIAQVEQERVAQVVDVLRGLELGDPRREHLRKERPVGKSD
jgi:hypothetical protein